ncbi:MAG: efflux RND transporter periplasmic adaptor subunit [Burkholderiaceae bacterium]
MNKTLLIVVAVTAALAAPLAKQLFAQDKTEPAATPLAAPAGLVVELREVTDAYAADGVIEAVKQATVSAQIPGALTRFLVDAGDGVKAGQVLAHIDTRTTDAQVAINQAQVAQAQAQLSQAKLNVERTQSLLAKNFVSQAALDKAQADFAAAQAAVAAAKAGTSQAQTSRSFAEIRSPIDGVVTRRLMETGELAQPGSPVIAVHDPRSLRAVGSIPQFMLPKIGGAGPISHVRVLVPGASQAIVATSALVLPAADPTLLSTQIRAELPREPQGAALIPGTAAKVLVPLGKVKRLVVPAQALIQRGEVTAVQVISAGGQPQLRQVRVGATSGDGWVEVLAGLSAGERVLPNRLAAPVAPAAPAAPVAK